MFLSFQFSTCLIKIWNSMIFLTGEPFHGQSFQSVTSGLQHVCSPLYFFTLRGGVELHTATSWATRSTKEELLKQQTSGNTDISRLEMARLTVKELFHGILFPGHLHTQDSLRLALKFQFRDTDILIVSYPKSGKKRGQTGQRDACSVAM